MTKQKIFVLVGYLCWFVGEPTFGQTANDATANDMMAPAPMPNAQHVAFHPAPELIQARPRAAERSASLEDSQLGKRIALQGFIAGALTTLVVGLLAGLIVVWRASRETPAPHPTDD